MKWFKHVGVVVFYVQLLKPLKKKVSDGERLNCTSFQEETIEVVGELMFFHGASVNGDHAEQLESQSFSLLEDEQGSSMGEFDAMRFVQLNLHDLVHFYGDLCSKVEGFQLQ